MKHNVNELDQIILEVLSDDFEPFESVVSKLSRRYIGFRQQCGGPVSSDRLFGFLSEKIIQFVIVEAVEM